MHERSGLRQSLVAVLVTAFLGCSATPEPPAGPATPGSGGRGGANGRGGAGGGVGGVPGSGGAAGGAAGGGTGGNAGAPGAGGTGGVAPADGPVGAGGSGPAPTDASSNEGGPACGAAGQACCAGNSCRGGASPRADGGAAGGEGMTVLELKASGGDPYALFAAKNLLPIDGPDRGYITDTGTSFLFVLHQNGAEETVSSGAQRQRNEVTVNPGNPAIYKGTKGSTMSYTWRFRLVEMNSNPTWCDIFQIKQHGPLGVAPYMALEADKGMLNVDTEKLGVIGRVPLSAIMDVWINASVTIKYDDAGSLDLLLKKDDGSTVLAYKNDKADMWDTTVDFVRPKWGLYRNKRDGAGEAAIHYNDMKIIRGQASNPAGPGCLCQ